MTTPPSRKGEARWGALPLSPPGALSPRHDLRRRSVLRTPTLPLCWQNCDDTTPGSRHLAAPCAPPRPPPVRKPQAGLGVRPAKTGSATADPICTQSRHATTGESSTSREQAPNKAISLFGRRRPAETRPHQRTLKGRSRMAKRDFSMIGFCGCSVSSRSLRTQMAAPLESLLLALLSVGMAV